MLLYVLKSMRPRQWSKNVVLFAPLLFTFRQYWHILTPTMWRFLALTVSGFVVFCLFSGVVYIINDLVDVEKDRCHPRKRLRPIASGKLSRRDATTAAGGIFVVATAGALALDQFSQATAVTIDQTFLQFPFAFTGVALSYMALQIAYSFWLKQMVIIDVFAIASGFLLRAVAGAAVLEVPISPWLYVVTMLLALFLGFSKRRNELTLLQGAAADHRAILREYTPELLDEFISITTASTVIAYSLYTFTADNLPRNHTMMLTIPFAVYGIFRYLYLIHIKNEGGSPEELLLKDRPLLSVILLWAASVVTILYLFGR